MMELTNVGPAIRKVKREGGREGYWGMREDLIFIIFSGSHGRVFLPHCTTLEGRSLQVCKTPAGKL